MAEVPDPQNVPDPAGSLADPVAPAIDPRDAELAELRAWRDQAAPIFERLKPYEEDVKYLLEDEDYATAQREMRKAYLAQREQRKKDSEPVYSPEEQRMADLVEARIKARFPDEAVEFVKAQSDQYRESKKREAEERTRQEADAKRNSEEFARSNIEYAKRLMSEGLSEEDVLEIGAYANALHERTRAAGSPKFVGLEEAYRKMTSRSARPAATAAPRSLRAHAAAPGIPGASKVELDRKELGRAGGVTAHMLKILNAKGA